MDGDGMIITLNFEGVGIKFNLKRHCDFSAFYQVFVENSYNNLLECIGKGDIVVDAGANNGVFTVMASVLVGNKGKVISIEPDPRNFQS
jgi:predicted RNA methylase